MGMFQVDDIRLNCKARRGRTVTSLIIWATWINAKNIFARAKTAIAQAFAVPAFAPVVA